MIGFDITPRIHPTGGAWGTTPNLTEVDLPLLSRCLVLDQDGRRLVWFSSDLVGDPLHDTDVIRGELAAALDLSAEQVVWSTSQTHSSGALPGSVVSGSCVTAISTTDPEFIADERKRLIDKCVAAAKEAIRMLRPAAVWAGRGFCDDVSYNTRLPMPTGGVKFSRHHLEGLQSGKYFDPTIGLIRFDDSDGKPIGMVFNFCAHPATMINDKYLSPDYVSSARQTIEAALGGAPAMFVQGFCGDVNCYHLFCKPAQARRTGTRLGQAAVRGLATLVPVRAVPFDFAWQPIELQCQPMPTRDRFEREIAFREQFFRELDEDPLLTWCGPINLPEHFPPASRKRTIEVQKDWLKKGLAMLDAGERPRTTLALTLGAVRIGDTAAVLSPGENFTITGKNIRERSPFAHTLICGDTNGLIGYMGPDDEIDRGGYETDSYWKMLPHDGFRLPPAKGTADRIVGTAVELLRKLHDRC